MNKRQFLLILLMALFGIILILGAFYWYSSYQDEASEGVDSAFGLKCGDGECDRIEKLSGICPQDCQNEASELTGEGLDALNLGIMIHLEGWFGEETDENLYMGHVEAIRTLADKLEEHGAVGTFEASPETIEASGNWDVNILQELVDRGHAVGVHADVGGNPNEPLTQELMAISLKEMKTNLEKVVDFDVQHVSGICSHLDWGQAVIDAGYEFTTGLVAYCVTAMDYEDRPDEYKDCKTPSKCHDVYPHEIAERDEPWRINSAKSWLTNHPDGDLVIIMEAGGLYKMNEEFGDGAGDGELLPDDVDAFVEQLDQFIANMDDDSVNTMYLSWSIGNAIRVQSDVVDLWLEKIDEYVEEGTVEWKTINEMYDYYVANE